jgi:hypothetical protein
MLKPKNIFLTFISPLILQAHAIIPQQTAQQTLQRKNHHAVQSYARDLEDYRQLFFNSFSFNFCEQFADGTFKPKNIFLTFISPLILQAHAIIPQQTVQHTLQRRNHHAVQTYARDLEDSRQLIFQLIFPKTPT